MRHVVRVISQMLPLGLLLSGCGPVTAVALLQNNTDFLGLVRSNDSPVSERSGPEAQPPSDKKEENHDSSE